MNNKRILSFAAILALLALASYGFIAINSADEKPYKGEEVHWTTIEEAAKRAKQDRKKILIDVYTDWCGWCKRMETTTYQDSALVKYINTHYHAVKLDAEQRENIVINGQTFTWKEGGRSGYNEFAYYLMNGQMSYPTTVFAYPGMDTLIAAVPGYLGAADMAVYVQYFNEEAFKTTSLEAYKKGKK